MGMPNGLLLLELLLELVDAPDDGGMGSTSNDVREAIQGRPVASYTLRALNAAISSMLEPVPVLGPRLARPPNPIRQTKYCGCYCSCCSCSCCCGCYCYLDWKSKSGHGGATFTCCSLLSLAKSYRKGNENVLNLLLAKSYGKGDENF
jgi:hypothetical protein